MNRFISSGIYVFLASVVVGELLALSVPAKAPYLELSMLIRTAPGLS